MDQNGDAFALGVESMDNEHRRLAALFVAFEAILKEADSLERAREIVQEALALANEHFEHEEALMTKYHYPAIEDEKFHHRHLRLQFTTMAGDTLNSGVCDQVSLENLAGLQRLLYEHITGPDRDLARYLIAKGCK